MRVKSRDRKMADPVTEVGTREKIIEAARSEFAQYGRAGARVDRIAEKAGVNKAMIYYHFHSKENLYHEVIGEFFRRLANRLRAQASQSATLEQLLLAAAEAHIHMRQTQPELGLIVLRELADPRDEALDQIASIMVASGLPNAICSHIEAAIQRGDLRKVDVRQTIISFLTMSLGYLLMAPIMDRIWGITDRASFLEERKYAMVDLIMNGLKAR